MNENKLKQCTRCKQNLTLDNYTIAKRSGWQGPRARCRNCCNLEMKENYFKNPFPQFLSNSKIRSKNKNIPFSINVEYLKSIFPKDNMCPVLKVPFQFGYKHEKNKDYAPSLDRIIPEKGYVEGNLIFVCDIVNRVKSNASTEILEKVSNFYKKFELTKEKK